MAPTIGVSPRGRMIHEMAMQKLETGRHQLAPVPAPPHQDWDPICGLQLPWHYALTMRVGTPWVHTF